jgi:hypothetical protein
MRGILSRLQRWLKRRPRICREAEKKFPNVPDRLTIYVHVHLAKYAQDRELLYLAAASGVILEYIQQDFLGETEHEYLAANKIAGTDIIHHSNPLRIILIAEMLFLLRRSVGFSEFCRRLKTRNLRSSFYEVLAA